MIVSSLPQEILMRDPSEGLLRNYYSWVIINKMSEIELEYRGELTMQCVHKDSGAVLSTDAPQEIGGLGKYFSPTDLVATGLGTCMLTLLGIIAKRLNLDISGTKAKVRKEMSTTPPRKIKSLWVEVRCPKKFDPETTQKLVAAMESCPVHYSLHPDVEQKLEFHWGST